MAIVHSLCKIFLGPQTILILGLEKEREEILRMWWVVLCFYFSALRFSSSSFSPFSGNLQMVEEDQTMSHTYFFAYIMCCLLPTGCLLPSPPCPLLSRINWHVPFCPIVYHSPSEVREYLGVVFVIYILERPQCIIVHWLVMIYWLWVVKDTPKGRDASIDFRASLICYISCFNVNK